MIAWTRFLYIYRRLFSLFRFQSKLDALFLFVFCVFIFFVTFISSLFLLSSYIFILPFPYLHYNMSVYLNVFALLLWDWPSVFSFFFVCLLFHIIVHTIYANNSCNFSIFLAHISFEFFLSFFLSSFMCVCVAFLFFFTFVYLFIVLLILIST